MSECKFCTAALAREEDDECQSCHDIWIWMHVNPTLVSKMFEMLTKERFDELNQPPPLNIDKCMHNVSVFKRCDPCEFREPGARIFRIAGENHGD